MTSTSASHLFIVDDQPDNLQLLEEILDTAGYTISCFPSAPLALSAAKRNPPDLFLLDIMMPEMDGYDLFDALKAESSLCERPVLFISALSATDYKTKALSMGAVDYITKPFVTEEVLARVATHLRLYRQQVEIKQAHARLKQLERTRDQLTGMLVHDLRSPLAGVLMSIELVKMEMEAKAADPDLIGMLSNSIVTCGQLKNLISNLLDIRKLEANRMPVHRQVLDLQKLISEACSTLHIHAGQFDLGVTPPALGDPGLTKRVLENLVSNAHKFSSLETIRIDVRTQLGYLRVQVSDEGPGIHKNQLDHIFDLFHQVDSETSSAMKGSGIGLAFCKLAMQAQGGEIGVESQPGVGSQFWFTLPLAEEVDSPRAV